MSKNFHHGLSDTGILVTLDQRKALLDLKECLFVSGHPSVALSVLQSTFEINASRRQSVETYRYQSLHALAANATGFVVVVFSVFFSITYKLLVIQQLTIDSKQSIMDQQLMLVSCFVTKSLLQHELQNMEQFLHELVLH